MIARWLFALLLLSPGTGLGHSWYDAGCCDDRDCSPVPARFNVDTGQIEIFSGAWYGLSDLRKAERRPRFLPSKDARYHACRCHTCDWFRCIYVAPGV